MNPNTDQRILHTQFGRIAYHRGKYWIDENAPMSTAPEDSHPLYQKPKPSDEAEPAAPKRGRRPRRPPEDRPTLTRILIAVNALIFLARYMDMDIQLFVSGALYPPAVVEGGQIYRLFSAMFLHASVGHIFFNMYALHVVGSTLEPVFGRLRFAIIYFLGGLAGSVLSLALGDYGTPSVGASGAVFAIFAAETLHLYQHRQVYVNVQGRLRQMVFLIAMNLFIGFLPGSRIDNWGHIGGMLGGLALAWRIAPRLRRPTAPIRSMSELGKWDTNPLRLRSPDLVIYVFVLVAVLALAMTLLGA